MPLEAAARAWAEPLGLAVAAMLVAVVGYRVGERLVERLTRHSRALRAVIECMRTPLQVLLPLAALDIVLDGAPDTLQGIETARHVGGVLLIAVFTWAAIAAVRGLADAVALLQPEGRADNLHARRVLTQTRVLARIAIGVLLFAGVAFILMTFPRARQFGTSLLASAGLSALVLGLAAQLRLRQPPGGPADRALPADPHRRRADRRGRMGTGRRDHQHVRGAQDLGRAAPRDPAAVVHRHPFQNWTRTTSQIIGSVFLWVDYTTDLEPLRAEATRLAKASKDYDGRVCLLQVVETSERRMQLRLIVSSPSAGQNWDLRCLLREGLIAYLQRNQPHALPRVRMDLQRADPARDDGLDPSVTKHGASPQLHARLAGTEPRERGDAAVSNATGMSELTAPTGGVRQAADAELESR